MRRTDRRMEQKNPNENNDQFRLTSTWIKNILKLKHLVVYRKFSVIWLKMQNKCFLLIFFPQQQWTGIFFTFSFNRNLIVTEKIFWLKHLIYRTFATKIFLIHKNRMKNITKISWTLNVSLSEENLRSYDLIS